MGEGFRVLTGDALPARLRFLERSDPFEFVAQETHQVGVDASQERIQGGAVEPPVVLHPASHNRVYPTCEISEGQIRPMGKPSATNRSAELLQGLFADGRRERRERHILTFIACPTRAERVAEERKRGVLVCCPPVRVL